MLCVHYTLTNSRARWASYSRYNNKYSALNGKLWFALVAISLKFNRNMRDIEHAMWAAFCSFTINTLSRLYEVYFVKHVLQASTASSHRVGKCIIEPSKQSRIRKSSFWSHRRSTVQWETALSSKERSRRVNCPMLVPYNYCNIYVTINSAEMLHTIFITAQIIILLYPCYIMLLNNLIYWGSDKL